MSTWAPFKSYSGKRDYSTAERTHVLALPHSGRVTTTLAPLSLSFHLFKHGGDNTHPQG